MCSKEPKSAQFLPKLIVYSFVLANSHSRHFFEHSLPAKFFQPVYFEFGVPNILQALWGDIDFLKVCKSKTVFYHDPYGSVNIMYSPNPFAPFSANSKAQKFTDHFTDNEFSEIVGTISK